MVPPLYGSQNSESTPHHTPKVNEINISWSPIALNMDLNASGTCHSNEWHAVIVCTNAHIFSSLASWWKSLQIGIRVLLLNRNLVHFGETWCWQITRRVIVGCFFLLDWIIGSRSIQRTEQSKLVFLKEKTHVSSYWCLQFKISTTGFFWIYFKTFDFYLLFKNLSVNNSNTIIHLLYLKYVT